MDPEADVMASYKESSPQVFASSFKPMEKTVCATCHTEQGAGNRCVLCHNYHVGHIDLVISNPKIHSSDFPPES